VDDLELDAPTSLFIFDEDVLAQPLADLGCGGMVVFDERGWW
jgi:hypothetical protein